MRSVYRAAGSELTDRSRIGMRSFERSARDGWISALTGGTEAVPRFGTVRLASTLFGVVRRASGVVRRRSGWGDGAVARHPGRSLSPPLGVWRPRSIAPSGSLEAEACEAPPPPAEEAASPPDAAGELGRMQPLPFRVPPGYEAERVAAPPLVAHPMFACLDDRGRLFVAGSAGHNLHAGPVARKTAGHDPLSRGHRRRRSFRQEHDLCRSPDLSPGCALA